MGWTCCEDGSEKKCIQNSCGQTLGDQDGGGRITFKILEKQAFEDGKWMRCTQVHGLWHALVLILWIVLRICVDSRF